MKFVRGISSAIKRVTSGGEGDGASVVKTVSKILSKISFATLAPIILPVVVIFIVLMVLVTTFGYKLNLMQFVDSSNTKSVDAIVFDEATLEEYYQLSNAAYETGNIPSVDLASTEYGSVDGFNEHIKDVVCASGYGTRNGVIGAGIALVGDYIKATGKRIRYDQGSRQYFDGGDNTGIINSNFYLDCSSFSWWALYNGGFNIPCWPYTGTQRDWSNAHGYSRTPGPGVGQGGDYLVSYGHIILILGTYDGGYYCAEESGWGTGAIISKRAYGTLGSYVVIDMTDYYNDQNNVRPDAYDCPSVVSDGGSDYFTPSKSFPAKFSLENYSHPGGSSFQYWLNVPEGATDGLPLVVHLHGDGEVNNPNALKNLPQINYMKNKHKGSPFIFIAPVTKEYSWTSGTIPTSLKGLIDKTVKQYSINTNKIYLIGFSRGATGVWNMVYKYPNYFAAAVPVSNCPYMADSTAKKFTHTKIKAISGTVGSFEASCNSCMNSYVNLINAAGGSAQKITYNGASHSTISSTIDYNSVFSWLLQQGGSYKSSSTSSAKGSLTSAQRNKIVSFARSQIGVAYNYGSGGSCGGGAWSNDVPDKQLSCNGLVYWAYHNAGVEVPRGSTDQMTTAPVVTSTGRVSDMSPGDVICYDKNKKRQGISYNATSIHHVAIYIGNGQLIEGTCPRVTQRSVSDNSYSYSVTW